jgi:hypothetical protein
MAIAIEKWVNKGLWVLCRSDEAYPQRLKQHLKRCAPPILYGAGDRSLLSKGGLAVVGYRHIDAEAEAFARAVGRTAAQSDMQLISGAARGVDETAMHGAFEEGGAVIGVMADSLLRAAVARPEDWIASTTRAVNPGLPPEPDEGLSRVIAQGGGLVLLAEWRRIILEQDIPAVLQAKASFEGNTLFDERRTAGPPDHILLKSDVERVQAGDRESLAFITALVVDKDGTVVPNAFHSLNFSSYGPGELLPQTWPGHPTGFTWNAVAGMTGIVFRATARIGRAVINAYSPGLGLGRCIVQVAAKGKKDEMEYRSGAQVY